VTDGPAAVDTLAIDDSPPLPVHRPSCVAELGELVKQARAAGQGVYPAGGRTTLDVGLPPLKPGFVVDTTALKAVIDYPARDLTVTVGAGLTLAALQAELAREGQWLPVDVAVPEKATLGGALALNQSGPRRYGYGTLRDYVIGINFVTDDGVEVKAGGRVVKNVAGYDLMKLQIGAHGTLGVITQMTLKVRPRPEASTVVAFGCSTDALGPVLDRLHDSRSRPVAVEVLNGEAWRSLGRGPDFASDWVVAVGFEEKAVTVAWQRDTLLAELRNGPARDVTELPDAAGLWADLTALQLRPESVVIGKTSVPPSRTAAVLASARGLVHAHGLNGIVWIHGEDQPEAAVLRRCPVAAKRSRPVWGTPPPAWELMRHVKRTLDPDDVFNPGRLFGDL
jgi:glycolate oxidase FAD binding subunit